MCSGSGSESLQGYLCNPRILVVKWRLQEWAVQEGLPAGYHPTTSHNEQ
jgi:hypothetical protein